MWQCQAARGKLAIDGALPCHLHVCSAIESARLWIRIAFAVDWKRDWRPFSKSAVLPTRLKHAMPQTQFQVTLIAPRRPPSATLGQCGASPKPCRNVRCMRSWPAARPPPIMRPGLDPEAAPRARQLDADQPQGAAAALSFARRCRLRLPSTRIAVCCSPAVMLLQLVTRLSEPSVFTAHACGVVFAAACDLGLAAAVPSRLAPHCGVRSRPRPAWRLGAHHAGAAVLCMPVSVQRHRRAHAPTSGPSSSSRTVSPVRTSSCALEADSGAESSNGS